MRPTPADPQDSTLATKNEEDSPSKTDKIRQDIGWDTNLSLGPAVLFHDLLIPYTSQLLGPNSKQRQILIRKFLNQQERYLGLDEDTRHHHFHNSNDRYEYIRDLGGGTTSKVEAVRIRGEPEGKAHIYARKLFDKPSAISDLSKRQTFMEDFEKERKCMQRCHHPHIVRFVESFTDDSYLGITMTPSGDMNLRQFLNDPRSGETSRAYDIQDHRRDIKSFYGCLLDAMTYLSQERIRHRDIKPENILVELDQDVGSQPRVLVCDFGLARYRQADERDTTNENFRGTGRYKAPELLSTTPQDHNERTDVWAMGCVFFEMHIVASGRHLSEVFKDLSMNKVDKPWTYDSKYAQVQGWLNRASDAQSRDPHEKARKNLVEIMLERDSNKRGSFRDHLHSIHRNTKLIGGCCKSQGTDGSESTRPSLATPTPNVVSPKTSMATWSRSNHSRGQSSVSVAQESTTYGRKIFEKSVRDFTIRRRKKKPSTKDKIEYDSWQNVEEWGGRRNLTVHQKTQHLAQAWQMVRYIQLSGKRDGGTHTHKHWLPYAHIFTAKNDTKVELQWSDCSQVTWEKPDGKAGAPGRTEYTWVGTLITLYPDCNHDMLTPPQQHLPKFPNWSIMLEFDRKEDAKEFLDVLLFAQSDPRSWTWIRLPGECALGILHIDWTCDKSRQSSCGSHAVSYISEAGKGNNNQLVRRMRLVFIPYEVDFEPAEMRSANELISWIMFHQVYEPRYVSNHQRDKKLWGENDIKPADPELQRQMNVHFDFSGDQGRASSRKGSRCQRFLKPFTDWQLLWSSSFDALCRERKLGKETFAKDGVVTVWKHRDKRETKLAFRWKCTDPRRRDLDVQWMTIEGLTDSWCSERNIHFPSQNHITGTLFRLNSASAAGPESIETTSKNQWSLKMRSARQRLELNKLLTETLTT